MVGEVRLCVLVLLRRNGVVVIKLTQPRNASNPPCVLILCTQPTTAPVEVAGAGGSCQTYRLVHGGETANSEATWESLNYNEAAVQFYLMLGGGVRAHVDEVLVCVNDQARERFEAKRAALLAAGKPVDEMWVFHGTPTQVRSAHTPLPRRRCAEQRGSAAAVRPRVVWMVWMSPFP